ATALSPLAGRAALAPARDGLDGAADGRCGASGRAHRDEDGFGQISDEALEIERPFHGRQIALHELSERVVLALHLVGATAQGLGVVAFGVAEQAQRAARQRLLVVYDEPQAGDVGADDDVRVLAAQRVRVVPRAGFATPLDYAGGFQTTEV